MHHELTESTYQSSQHNLDATTSFGHHGSYYAEHGGLPRHLHSPGSSSASPRSIPESHLDGQEGVNADQLDARLRGLNSPGGESTGRCFVPGQRVLDHENALSPSTPRQALGFRVVKSNVIHSGGVQLTDFPTEILTHIMSHLHPDSHAALSLVSKQFYNLVKMPHAWRLAFLRYFPGKDSVVASSKKAGTSLWDQYDPDKVTSEYRSFTRLTGSATWRSEYLLRTRLLRNVARGKPGNSVGSVGAASRSGKGGKKVSAVLTYSSKLPWVVTSLHAVFVNGKRPPRAIHATGDLGMATISDPTNGKVEKWGLEDLFSFSQLEEVSPDLQPYGLGSGPAALPNVADVSQTFGLVAGEGFPGGRVFFRSTHERLGKYLGGELGVADTYPEIPRIPTMSEGISSVWIARSSNILTMTHSMVGMLTGSTLGVVTAYAIGWDPSGPKYANGDMTARWVICPGVPIVALRVDENYNQKRKAAGRVWAVALNALGELYYLTDTPSPNTSRVKGDDLTKSAWAAGRTVSWHLIEPTRRTSRLDDYGDHVTEGTHTPRSSPNSANLSRDQMMAEARELEKFMQYKPAHFRKVFHGWDMRRKLEVDFASDDGHGAGEALVLIDCGHQPDLPACVQRYTRVRIGNQPSSRPVTEIPSVLASESSSLFGSGRDSGSLASPTGQLSRNEPADGVQSDHVDDWRVHVLSFRESSHAKITASAIDCSTQALVTATEERLRANNQNQSSDHTSSLASSPEIPGRRARLLAIGTDNGSVFVWNTRESPSGALAPVRIIQTESPEISSLALSALYLVHGGSDGLVQAWDPLASTLEPLRTMNARSHGRVPRHLVVMNPGLHPESYMAAGAIYLDPDATVLRGIVAFGAFLRYWSYSSTAQSRTSRKRRLRHSDIHGRLTSRRQGGSVSDYISAEAAELRREKELQARYEARMRNRFGIGALGDMTEAEALQYVQMISEESFTLDEQRRTSASDTGSAADVSVTDTASSDSYGTLGTATPDPSISSVGAPIPEETEEEDDYELQIQRALRLSLLEGVNDTGDSPRGNSSGEFEVPIKIKPRKKGKGRQPTSPTSDLTSMLVPEMAGPSTGPHTTSIEDDDLALAIRLSLQDQTDTSQASVGPGMQADDFPRLEYSPKGKGKGKGIF